MREYVLVGGLNQGGQNSTNPFDDGVGRLFRKSNATPHPGPLRASGTSLTLVSFHNIQLNLFFLHLFSIFSHDILPYYLLFVVICNNIIRIFFLDILLKQSDFAFKQAYNKAVTRIQVPTKTTLKISTTGRKQTRCHNRENLINLTHRDHIIHLMYQTLIG